ncbi:MAG TPA: elongator complex protein 3 [Desulfobacterales bacterium]
MNASSKPLIVPVFLPHQGCPHRCVFCNQYRITAASGPPPRLQSLKAEIERFLSFGGKDRSPTQIAFFGGNFLGQRPDRIERLLDLAGAFVQSGRADGIRFSTRPDSITPDRIAALKSYPVTDVELGVQSMDDAVLRCSRRGHTAADTCAAAHRIKAAGYRLGLQMMVGLPGETGHHTFETARKIAALGPDYVRIYPTLVLADSPLADWMQAGRYDPLSLEEALDRVQETTLFFLNHGIAVIRIGLPVGFDCDGVLAGPRHPAFGHLVHSRLFLKMACRLLEDCAEPRHSVAFCVHPGSYSRMQGLRSRNFVELRRRFGISEIRLNTAESLPPDGLRLAGSAAPIRYRDLTSGVEALNLQPDAF